MTTRSQSEDVAPTGNVQAEVPVRTARQLLVDRRIGPYFAAKLVSNVGVWIHNVVAAVLMYELTRSALLVGLVSVCQFTPQLVLAPYAGALADRGRRQLQAVAGRALSALGSALLAVSLLAVGPERAGPAMVLVSASVVGLGFALGTPAMHALVPSLVRRDELGSLITIDTTPMTIARSVGPALGALLLTLSGPVTAFAVAATFQLALAIVVSGFRLPPTPQPNGGDRSALGGFRYLRVDPTVGLLLLSVVGIGLGVDPVITLTPAVADQLGGNARLVASMASAFGLGAASTPLFLGWLRKRWQDPSLGRAGLLLLAGGMGMLGLSPVAWTAVVSLYLGGVGMMLSITCVTTQLQRRLPEELRGRIMGLWTVAFIGSRPLAATINGALADLFSVQVALTVLAAGLIGIAYLARPARVDTPVPDAVNAAVELSR